jgi:alcohol dehydrogenase class IV
MHFEFATTGRVIFGPGTFKRLPDVIQGCGARPLFVTGSSNRFRLQGAVLALSGEPTFQQVRDGVALGVESRADVVVAVGGGAAIDAGKAIAMLLTNGGDPLDYAEVIGHAKPVATAPLPFIAVPTTAGAGSEATRNAVLTSPEHRVKVSLRSPLMLPRIALIDPELTYGLPAEITASTGMDALSQLIEPFVSVRANPLTDALCREGIRRVAKSLLRAYRNGHDAAARADLAAASLFGGMALANAGLGAVHGLAAPIGGMFAAAHGAVCAALLPAATMANAKALRARATDGEALRRYVDVARLLTNDPRATIEEGVRWLTDLATSLGIPRLRDYGISARDMPAIVEKAQASSSMKGNPIPLTNDEVAGILQAAL